MQIKYSFLVLVIGTLVWLAYREFGVLAATPSPTAIVSPSIVNPRGSSVGSRLEVPPGYTRVKLAPNSVGSFLRQLAVHPHQAPVLLYNGQLKNRQDVHVAVLTLDTGTKNLQQCADAVMRLRAEYLFGKKQFTDIHFNFTSGHRADFTKYAEGYRPVITSGDQVQWVKKAAPSYAYKTFRQYLDLVFTYAGTASLTKELRPVPAINQVEPGDVFIQGGSPGHAVMVMDVAVHEKTGQKVFLLAQSYMPAQQIHILRNPANAQLSPWYSTNFSSDLQTPEWAFNPSDLKRFATW